MLHRAMHRLSAVVARHQQLPPLRQLYCSQGATCCSILPLPRCCGAGNSSADKPLITLLPSCTVVALAWALTVIVALPLYGASFFSSSAGLVLSGRTTAGALSAVQLSCGLVTKALPFQYSARATSGRFSFSGP